MQGNSEEFRFDVRESNLRLVKQNEFDILLEVVERVPPDPIRDLIDRVRLINVVVEPQGDILPPPQLNIPEVHMLDTIYVLDLANEVLASRTEQNGVLLHPAQLGVADDVLRHQPTLEGIDMEPQVTIFVLEVWTSFLLRRNDVLKPEDFARLVVVPLFLRTQLCLPDAFANVRSQECNCLVEPPGDLNNLWLAIL